MPEPADPRQRAWHGLTARPGRGQVLVAVLLGLLGFAAAVQVRSVDSGSEYAGARRGDLVQLLETVSAAQSRTLAQLSELEQTRAELEASTEQREAALNEAQDRLDMVQLLSGQVGATGPGIAVTIEDPDGTVGATTLLNAVEELRDAGAEALEVNNEARIVAQTWFGDAPDLAGGSLAVDGRTVSAPYIIEAIGARETLAEAVTFPGGLADEVEALGGTVAVAASERVLVESLAPEPDTEFADPST